MPFLFTHRYQFIYNYQRKVCLNLLGGGLCMLRGQTLALSKTTRASRRINGHSELFIAPTLCSMCLAAGSSSSLQSACWCARPP